MNDAIQAKVTAILASLLAVERVDLDDDFFMLGGDSLHATVLMVALEKSYGVVIDPVEIFERPKVREFVVWLEQVLAESVARSAGSRS